jgi:glycosyltransferase involved in cell wall biosynthesis
MEEVSAMSLTLALSFTNLGPYHLARLRAVADRLRARGGRLIAYETAGSERLYPWQTTRGSEPFDWVTLFPGRTLETISAGACARAIRRALERDQPDALATAGYYRPEATAALGWARRAVRPAILMSESQAIDHRRTWWKETLKGWHVRRFSAALVGGPRHRDYLCGLGMPRDRITLGYNAVDNAALAGAASHARASSEGRRGLPAAPYFLAVSRFVPEKNLPRLIAAFAAYRRAAAHGESPAWDLALCGSGGGADAVERAIASSGFSTAIHRPGFLQADELARWYAFASAFVHPSLLEPWGLVVNEAAACALPLLVSDRAGCVDTLVPHGLPELATGARFDPRSQDEIAARLQWIASLPDGERQAMGQRAAEQVSEWGPERFAQGLLEALVLATGGRTRAVLRGARRPHWSNRPARRATHLTPALPHEGGGRTRSSLR